MKYIIQYEKNPHADDIQMLKQRSLQGKVSADLLL